MKVDMVSNDKYYKPEEALYELMLQETMVLTAIDIQALLRILVDKDIIAREEIAKYREEVRNSPKYKTVIEKSKKESEEEKMESITIRNNKVNLCGSCKKTYPDCGCKNVLFGDGIGQDNICCCDAYIADKEKSKKESESFK